VPDWLAQYRRGNALWRLLVPARKIEFRKPH
jgi:hypothetical protein